MKRQSMVEACLALLAIVAPRPLVAQSLVWVRQLGTSNDEDTLALASNGAGGVYAAGYTGGVLGGPIGGPHDAWLARYDGTGAQYWIRQFGTFGDDKAVAAVSDGTGGVFLCGYTAGSLGGPNAGSIDAWLARYDAGGNQVWMRQLGTSEWDEATALAQYAPGYGLYLCGWTRGDLGGPSFGAEDAWLARYDNAGNQVFLVQIGAAATEGAFDVTPDASGGAYVSGYAIGALGWPSAGLHDAWIARYDSTGNQAWLRLLGSSGNDMAFAAAPDGAGGVYVGGKTDGSLGGPSAGSWDGWLSRFDSAGNRVWLTQVGTVSYDELLGAAADELGGVYVGGSTAGNMNGPVAGVADAWLARYDRDGNQSWVQQFGPAVWESLYVASGSGVGELYIGGSVTGSFGGPWAGGPDAWLARYDSPCSVLSTYCTSGSTTHNCIATIAGNGTASASAGAGFTVTISGVEGVQTGRIFYGLSGPAAFPWGASTSFLCIKSPLQRAPASNSGGTLNACNGVISLDWNHYIATNPFALGSPFLGGETVYAQGWFRDPPSPKGTNLSNALLFTTCP